MTVISGLVGSSPCPVHGHRDCHDKVWNRLLKHSRTFISDSSLFPIFCFGCIWHTGGMMLQVLIFIIRCSCDLPSPSTVWHLLRAGQIRIEKKIKEYLPEDLELPYCPPLPFLFISFRIHFFLLPRNYVSSMHLLQVRGTPGNQMKRNDLQDLSKTVQGFRVQNKSL